MEDAFDVVNLWVLIEKIDKQEEYFRHIVRVIGGVHKFELLDMTVHDVMSLHVFSLPLRHAFRLLFVRAY